LVDAAGNPVLSYHLAGAVEAMQPLMNMITFSARSRGRIVKMHRRIFDSLEARDGANTDKALAALADYTSRLFGQVLARRQAQSTREEHKQDVSRA